MYRKKGASLRRGRRSSRQVSMKHPSSEANHPAHGNAVVDKQKRLGIFKERMTVEYNKGRKANKKKIWERWGDGSAEQG